MLKEIGSEIVKYSISESAKNIDNGDSIPKAVVKGIGSGILSLLLCVVVLVGGIIIMNYQMMSMYKSL